MPGRIASDVSMNASTRSPGHRRPALLPIVLACCLLPGVAQAQWSAVPSSANTESGNDALVRSEEGGELRIWLDVDSYLRASFRLEGGLARLDEAGCPTFQIDDTRPEDLSEPAHECSVDGTSAQVVLTQVSEGELDSRTLVRLMNGSRLGVRYRLAHAGYGAITFSLRGSKQALLRALGDQVQVREE